MADHSTTDSPTRPQQCTAGPPLAIATLGRFEVTVGGTPATIPVGLPAQAVKFVVAAGGRAHGEAVIDALWPEARLEEGRKGLRNVLSRLSKAGAPVLVRDGEAIRIADRVSVDALAFRAAADRVLVDAARPGAAEGARFALARYGGEFLPDDHFHEWTEAPRYNLRRRQVSLIDLLAEDAKGRGAALEAVALMEMAIELAPEDEIRSIQAAELLIAAGRRGRAAAHITRARQALRDQGLMPGEQWMRLQRHLSEHQDRTAAPAYPR